MTTMALMTVGSAAVLGSLLVLVVGTIPNCQTFNDVCDQSGTVSCAKECMRWGTEEDPKVYGTLLYHPSSDVCRSGLHAGVLSLDGGSLEFDRRTISQRTNHGTCRNRICSQSIGASGTVFSLKETENFIHGKVGGDVMLIHNSYYKDKLEVLCLNEDLDTQYTSSNIRKWNYKDGGFLGIVKEPSKVLLSVADEIEIDNYHALHCMGRSAVTDVLAPLIFRDAEYRASQYTWRASTGEDLDIEIIKKNQHMAANRTLIRYPKPDVPENTARLTLMDEDSPPLNRYHLRLQNVSPDDTGLYQLGDHRIGAFFNIIIRDCMNDMYGKECQTPCPECQNGGQCHSYTGECLCPPGFIGNHCQHACPEGFIGNDCQFYCHRKTLYLELLEDGSCKGLTICLPGPLGCSCPAGFKGPLCDEPCTPGTYGAGCVGICQEKCLASCDQHTGSCTYEQGLPYTHSPTNVKSTITGPGQLTVSWDDPEYDQNRFYFVTYQLKKRWFCRIPSANNEEKKLMTVREGREVVLRDLEANSEYEVCVTSSDIKTGRSVPACVPLYTYTSMQRPSLNVTLSCKQEGSKSIRCSATVLGNCSDYKGPNTKVIFELSSYLPCDEREIRRSQDIPLGDLMMTESQEIVTYLFKDLFRGLWYNISATISNDAGLGDTTTEGGHVFLKGGIPNPVENLTVAIMDENQIRLLWNDPCPPNGIIDGYQIDISCPVFSRKDRKVSKSDTKCPPNTAYDGCYDVDGLNKGTRYHNFFICRFNNGVCYMKTISGRLLSAPNDCDFVMEEQKPSGVRLRQSRQSKSLTILPPKQPGGKLVNCSITVLGETCVLDYTENEPMTCKFDDLELGKLYATEGFCCNNRHCGDRLKRQVVTRLMPNFEGSLRVGVMSNSTVSVTLPRITKEGAGNSSLVIAVEHVTEGINRVRDLKYEVEKRLPRRYRSNEMNAGNRSHAWQMSDGNNCNEAVRITGIVSADTEEFVVGDAKYYGGFYNCPLEVEEVYNLGVLAVTTLSDQRAVTWNSLYSPLKVTPSSSITTIVVVLIVGLLILCIVLLRLSLFACAKIPVDVEEQKERTLPYHKKADAKVISLDNVGSQSKGHVQRPRSSERKDRKSKNEIKTEKSSRNKVRFESR